MTYAQAQMDALNRGREEGREEGRVEGIAIGEARGKAEGASLMAKLAKLAMLLARDGKFDDIGRAGSDEGFLKMKLMEYGIS